VKRIKLAVWGIAEHIWNSIIDTIDPRKADILFWADNNRQLEGKAFAAKPVYVQKKEILENLKQVDYVLIAAYSGFQQIRQTLIENGYPQEKIQLYVTGNMKLYDLGSLSDTNEELISKIYFEPQKRLSEVHEYQKTYKAYEKVKRFEENTGRWYEKGPLISHACGGVVNGKKIMYSNSKEALKYSLENKFQLIECDVLGIEQGEVMLAHDFNRFYESVEEKYTMQNLEEALLELSKSDANLLIDIKWSHISEYSWYISRIADMVKKIGRNDREIEKLKKQVVMEVYEEESIKCAYANGFDMFFTQYRNVKTRRDFMTLACLCEKYNIGAVGFDRTIIENYKKSIALLKNKNIRIFVFSCDSIEDYHNLTAMGIDGVFTNHLTYRDIV